MRERERERDSWYFQCFQSQSSSMAVTPRRALISSEPETKTWCQSLKFALWLETISVDKTEVKTGGEVKVDGESYSRVLPYLKQQRKLNFLVGSNIQVWLAKLQTRCKHVVCSLTCWASPSSLPVSIRLVTLPEVRHILIDLSHWEPGVIQSHSHHWTGPNIRTEISNVW